MKATALILSPYFPPSTLAGVHRARLLAKHLPAHGWRPIILCVDEAYHEQRLDPDLAALVPPETEIVKAPARAHAFRLGQERFNWEREREGFVEVVSAALNIPI